MQRRQPGAACVPIRSDALFIARPAFTSTLRLIFMESLPRRSLTSLPRHRLHENRSKVKKKKKIRKKEEKEVRANATKVPVNIKDRISLVVRRMTIMLSNTRTKCLRVPFGEDLCLLLPLSTLKARAKIEEERIRETSKYI